MKYPCNSAFRLREGYHYLILFFISCLASATVFQCRENDAKQVSKSLVVQLNKARQPTLSEIPRDKLKSNAGSVREARRRRQMFGEKARKSGKYLLAAKPLVAEFNLR